MRLLVVGASGRTGRLAVEQALGHGHDVTAFVRDPSKLGVVHERLRVVAGDVTEPSTLGPAVDGQDAAISALGSPAAREVHAYSDGTANLLRAMTARGVHRLVVLSAAGAGDRSGRLPLSLRVLLASPGRREVYADMERMEGDVMLSDLVWTIVRPARLIDGPQIGHYRVVEGSIVPNGSQISRADLAGLLLKCAETDLYAGMAVSVAY